VPGIMTERDDVSRADFLQRQLRVLLDAKPVDHVAVDQARVALAAARELVAVELQKAAMKRENNALQNVELERELLELKKAQLVQTPVPVSATATAPSRSIGVRTPPPAAMPVPLLPSDAEQLVGLDDEDKAAASAATAVAASLTEDVRQLTSKLMASLRADLLRQQIIPQAATLASAGVAGDATVVSEPLVAVKIACQAMNTTLVTLEGRLARYHALEQQLMAVSHMEHVELNVGGERFHTTVATLCKEPSYLQGMFSGCD
jgi:hypothetical protein